MNRLMKSNDIQIIDQILWIVSNACGEGENIRDFVLDKIAIMECLHRIITEALDCKTILKQGMLKTMVWCISNLVRNLKNHENLQLKEQTAIQACMILSQLIETQAMQCIEKEALSAYNQLLQTELDSVF